MSIKCPSTKNTPAKEARALALRDHPRMRLIPNMMRYSKSLDPRWSEKLSYKVKGGIERWRWLEVELSLQRKQWEKTMIANFKEYIREQKRATETLLSLTFRGESNWRSIEVKNDSTLTFKFISLLLPTPTLHAYVYTEPRVWLS